MFVQVNGPRPYFDLDGLIRGLILTDGPAEPDGRVPSARWVPSPLPLRPQGLREVAAIHVLAEVIELALEIDEHLAADVAPEPAEREILRQIAARIRIDH